LNYAWTLFSQEVTITGIYASFFAINGTDGFSNDLRGGRFSVSLNNHPRNAHALFQIPTGDFTEIAVPCIPKPTEHEMPNWPPVRGLAPGFSPGTAWMLMLKRKMNHNGSAAAMDELTAQSIFVK